MPVPNGPATVRVNNEASTVVSITMNLSPVGLREVSLNGRDYLVVPTVMLVKGVHNGSNGPLMYMEEDMQRSCTAWNHKPVVLYHPEQGSASEVKNLENQYLGLVLNARWDGKLRCDTYLDIQRCDQLDTRIIKNVRKGQTIEVSTGLAVDLEPVENGEFEGVEYKYIARNHQPDHLAILLDSVGACSVEDGAGLFQLNEMSFGNIRGELQNTLADGQWVEDVYATFFVYMDSNGLWQKSYATTETGVEVSNDAPVAVYRATEYRTVDGNQFVGNVRKGAAMNREALVNALINNEATHWTEDDRQDLMAMNEDVLKKMQLKEVANAAAQGASGIDPQQGDQGATSSPPASTQPQNVANATQPEGQPQPQPAQPQPQTPEQYIAAAPPGIRGMLQASLQTHNQQREALIEQIVANQSNRFTREWLASQEIDVLQGIGAMASPATTTPNYAGAGGAPPVLNDAAGNTQQPGLNVVNEVDDEPLIMPTMEFKKEAS